MEYLRHAVPKMQCSHWPGNTTLNCQKYSPCVHLQVSSWCSLCWRKVWHEWWNLGSKICITLDSRVTTKQFHKIEYLSCSNNAMQLLTGKYHPQLPARSPAKVLEILAGVVFHAIKGGLTWNLGSKLPITLESFLCIWKTNYSTPPPLFRRDENNRSLPRGKWFGLVLKLFVADVNNVKPIFQKSLII